MLDHMKSEIFQSFDGVLARQGVDRVLHSIRGQDFPIVARSVRRLEIAFKADGEAQLANVVTPFLLGDAEQAHLRFSVRAFSEANRHGSAPEMRGGKARLMREARVNPEI